MSDQLREQLIAALEHVRNKEARKREWETRHGESFHGDVEKDKIWSHEKLCEYLAAGWGFPLGTRFSESQFLTLVRADLTGADLEEFDHAAQADRKDWREVEREPRSISDWMASYWWNPSTKWEHALSVAWARWIIADAGIFVRPVKRPATYDNANLPLPDKQESRRLFDLKYGYDHSLPIRLWSNEKLQDCIAAGYGYAPGTVLSAEQQERLESNR